MTPQEHYETAERLMAVASEDLREPSSTPLDRIALRVAAAQVHATLATCQPAPISNKQFFGLMAEHFENPKEPRA